MRTADRAILGASIRTLDPDRPWATAVAMRDGVIVAVGSDAEVREQCNARTELLDGDGLHVVPGLVDAHIHPFNAKATLGADLTQCADLADLRAALNAEAQRAGPGGWVRGWGLDYGAFGADGLEGRHLEDAVRGAPALVILMDGHTGVASPEALARAGVTGAVAFAEAAEVVLRDGQPTGELREPAAIELVAAHLPVPAAAELRAHVVATLRALNAVGVTGVHAMNGDRSTLALLDELEATGALSLRAIVPFTQDPDLDEAERVAQLELRDAGGRRWRGGVAKFFADGVIDTGTGWLEEPDTRGDGLAPFWPDPARYAETVARFGARGFQCVTHAIGDRAVRAALDAYRAVPPAAGVRHRVEHMETMADRELARFVDEGVVPSMQPLHMQWRAADGSDAWAARLGPERAARAWRSGDLVRSGAVLPLGSDWPVAGFDPRVGMAWARLRRTPGRPDAHVFEPEQRLSAETALAGYTLAPAWAACEERVAGRIAIGFRADLTLFAEDPVAIDADALLDLPVRLTVVDGEVVHRG